MQDSDADDDDLDLLLDQGELLERHAATPASSEAPPWRILIADDDVDVHVVTKFALHHAEFQGRRLSYLHAYSGAETLDVLRAHPEVALILLDVVMETPDAGLHVARAIRAELQNPLTRIVLRTGQPGHADEGALVRELDLHDFWSKADLTTRALLTTVITGLRSYAALAEAEQRIAELDQRVARLDALRAAVERHLPMLAVNRRGQIDDISQRLCELLGRERRSLLGRPLAALGEADADQLRLRHADGTPFTLPCAVEADAQGWIALGLLNA